MQDAASADNSIIPSLISPQSINLLGGASSSGKSRLLLPLMLSYLRDGTFLTHSGLTPVPVAWLNCDRTSDSFHKTIRSLDLQWSQSLMPVVSWQDYTPNAEGSLTRLYRALPAQFRANPLPKLLVIESFQSLLDEGNPNIFRDVSRFYQRVNHFLRESNCAILGTVHSPKLKQDESYARKQDCILGSVAWPSHSHSLFYLESLTDDATDPRRLLQVHPHSAAPYTLKLDINALGHLIPVQSHSSKDPDGWRQYFEGWLEAVVGDDIPTSTFLEWMDTLNGMSDTPTISRVTVFRWIDDQVRNGKLRRIKKGVYRKMKAC